jgi:hypothetical protein
MDLRTYVFPEPGPATILTICWSLELRIDVWDIVSVIFDIILIYNFIVIIGCCYYNNNILWFQII